MWLDEEKPILKRDLVLSQPFVNASGTLGFFPDLRAQPAILRLGAFITNPISRRQRQPAANRACLPFPGGLLLHTGHPNPGVSRAISRFGRRWAGAPLPVIVHLLVESPVTLTEMIHKLEVLENILAVELGLPPGCDPDMLSAVMAAGAGEIPLIPCLSLEQVPILLEALKDLQPTALHLVEPRGALPGPDGEIIMGRLYGPAIFPIMMAAAQVLINAGLRVIANGGVCDPWQVDALMKVGVTAVGLGSVLWQVDPIAIFPELQP
jgi:dihydroorotate dehydrogenase (NAD+) catalytic subunit